MAYSEARRRPQAVRQAALQQRNDLIRNVMATIAMAIIIWVVILAARGALVSEGDLERVSATSYESRLEAAIEGKSGGLTQN